MSVELIGLAYDEILADQVWSQLKIRDAIDFILDDEFRRRVDFRSMLYHKGHIELLSEFDQFLKQGGEQKTILEFMAARFSAGVEDFPSRSGDWMFDFHLVRHFASLAMADDYLVADPFLRELLRKVGFLKNGTAWSLIEARDFDSIVVALRDVRMQDILEVGHRLQPEEGRISFENLVRNYIEFLSYTHNNGLTPFFYNSQTDLPRWGNLADRRNRRSEQIVDLSLNPSKRKKDPSGKGKGETAKQPKKDFQERMKARRQSDALVSGLKDSDPLIRQKAAESLGRLADPSTLSAMIEALSDPEPEVRQEIVRAIGAIPGKDSVEPLLTRVDDDESGVVRLVAAHVLRRRGEKQVLQTILKAVESAKPLFSILAAYHPDLSTMTDKIIRMAEDDRPEVRRDAAFILGRLAPSRSESALVKLLKDRDEEVRSNALYALWDSGSKKVKELSSSADTPAASIVSHWASA